MINLHMNITIILRYKVSIDLLSHAVYKNVRNAFLTLWLFQYWMDGYMTTQVKVAAWTEITISAMKNVCWKQVCLFVHDKNYFV